MAKKNKADTQEIELSAKKSRTNANSRGRTSAKAKREAEEKEIQRRIEKAKRRNQRTAIILLAVSVLLFAFVIVSGENVWKFCHDVCMGLFGGWAVLWPILLAAVAVLLAFDKLEAKNIRVKLILLTVVILVACTTVFTYSDIPFTPGLGYINKLGFLYKNGVNTAGAGLCSGIFGVPLIDLFGVVGARIFNTILLIVMIIFLSGLTLNEILSKPAKAAHMVKAAGARHYRERLERREVRRQNIYSNSYDDDFNFPEGTVFSSGEYSDTDYSETVGKENKYEKNPESSPEVKLNLLDKLKKVFHIEDDEELYDEYLEEQGDEYREGDEPHRPQFSQITKNSIPKTPEQNPERIYGFSQEARNKVPKVIVQINDDEVEADNSAVSPADEPLTYEFKLPEVEDAPTYPEETNVAHEDYVEPDKHDSTEIHDCKIEEKAEEHTDSQTPVYSEIKLTKQPIQYEEPRVVKRDANSGLSVPLDTEADILAERQKLAEQALAEREATERQDMANKAQMALYNNLKNDANTYIFPPVTMLKASDKTDTDKEVSELQSTSQSLVDILQSFGVKVSIAGFSRGPSVTRYEITPAPGVKVSKITNLSDDIALNLAATGVRIEAPIPGKAAVGIEVPNKSKSVVKMRELVESNAFMTAKSKLTVTLGKDIGGQVKVADLAKMPHMLIAGTTGSGKSVCINSLIISLIYKASPDDVKLLMIDPKVVELGVYNGIPHLLVPVVTDPRKASGALSWAVTEMLNRYKTFAEFNVRDISGYNMLAKSRGYKDDFDQPMLKMPQIVIIIDELADLMMAAPNEVEDSICRLAQMARAAGMHLVVATQRPTVDVVTGLIKANIPSRIAFAVSSAIDSRTILDAQGAEKLLGQGDMLFSPVGAQKPTRIQGCFVSDAEIESIVSFIKGNREITYDESINEAIERNAAQSGQKAGDKAGGGDDFDDTPENDPVLDDAIRIVTEAGQASTSLLQRKLGLGYARAGRYIDKLEQLGIIGPYQGSKPRQVLMSRAQWLERNMQKPDELVKAELDE